MSAHVKLRTHLCSSVGCAVAAMLAMSTLASAQEASAKDEVFAPTKQSPVFLPTGSKPLVSFDISWVDPVLKNYYLCDRSNRSVDVINTDSKAVSLIQPISNNLPPVPAGQPNTFVGARGIDSVTHLVCGPPTGGTCVASNDVSGPDGVLTVDNSQIWVGDGDSRGWVLDAKTGNPISVPARTTNPLSTVRTGSNPNNRADELCYDSADHLVMVANNADSPPFASIISTQTYK